MAILYIIFLFFSFKIKLIKALSPNYFLNDVTFYLNEICSYNGKPTLDPKTNEVTCECEDKYINEPRKNKIKYINGHMIQCSYEKKTRFKAFYLAALAPIGMNFLYLGYIAYFVLNLFVTTILFFCNIASFILNYQLNKKIEEINRQKKLKRANKKYEYESTNAQNLNDNYINIFSKVTDVLTIADALVWTLNIILQAAGIIPDSNGVPTLDDMNYYFEVPKE